MSVESPGRRLISGINSSGTDTYNIGRQISVQR